MDTQHEVREDCFVVFVRAESPSEVWPEALEEEEVVCASHEEAERVRHEYHLRGRTSVIRYVGPSGGGD